MAGEWLQQLPEDLRTNEALTGHATLGDLAKSHLEAQGKLKEFDGKTKEFEGKIVNLESKLVNSIQKPSDKSTPEELANYRKALGVPEKSEEYEFPKIKDKENSPEMIAWAQKTFHKHGLTKEQATGVGQDWNDFIEGMVEAEEKFEEDTKVENEKKFHGQFKNDEEFKAGYELTKRFWKKITDTDFDEVYKETDAWQIPLFMNFIFSTARAVGEDWSPRGSGVSGGEVRVGIKYKDMEKFK